VAQRPVTHDLRPVPHHGGGYSPPCSPGNGAAQTPAAEARPVESIDLVGRVGCLLREGQAQTALDVLRRSRASTSWAVNATGVCLLRLGEVRQAIDVFRSLVLRPDVPPVFKTNFATALLMDGNVAGCTSVLGEFREEDHPVVRNLRAAIRRWQEGMSFWEKVWWHLGSPPDRAVELGFVPGEL
jgi:hypothetical protein